MFGDERLIAGDAETRCPRAVAILLHHLARAELRDGFRELRAKSRVAVGELGTSLGQATVANQVRQQFDLGLPQGLMPKDINTPRDRHAIPRVQFAQRTPPMNS